MSVDGRIPHLRIGHREVRGRQLADVVDRGVERVGRLDEQLEVDLVGRVHHRVVVGIRHRRRHRRRAAAIDALDVGRDDAAEQLRDDLEARVDAVDLAQVRGLQRLVELGLVRVREAGEIGIDRRRTLEVDHREDRLVRDDLVLAVVVVAAVEAGLLAVVRDEHERVLRLAVLHAARGDREQLGDAAAVVGRAGEPRVVVRAEHDHLRALAVDLADDVDAARRRRSSSARRCARARSCCAASAALIDRAVVGADRDRGNRLGRVPAEAHRADLAQVLRRDRQVEHRGRALRRDVAQLRRAVKARLALDERDLAGEIDAREIAVGRAADVDDLAVGDTAARCLEHVEAGRRCRRRRS